MFCATRIPSAQAWQMDPATERSFDAVHEAVRISGPARLIRFVTLGGSAPEGREYGPNRAAGAFWFAESDLLRLRLRAVADLELQRSPNEVVDSVQERLPAYLRQEFRQFLAIRRDWTPSFDGYVVLTVPTGSSIVALRGRIREQAVYSPGVPGADTANASGLRLEGGWVQYVIRFDFAPNRMATQWIMRAPIPF